VPATHTFVGGRPVISGGRYIGAGHPERWIEAHNRAAARIVRGA